MCAYVERDQNDNDRIADFLTAAGLGLVVDQVLASGNPGADNVVRSRPAFGGNASARLFGMIALENGDLKVYDPIWWFDVDIGSDQGLNFGDRTSFNARRLHYPLWRDWLPSGRALVLATAIGEAKQEGGKKMQFRMVGETPFLLGGLIKPLGDGRDHAAAVITRDAHPKMSPYHEKAFPCFVPPGMAMDWLADGMNEPARDLLDHPTLTTGLQVTRVKSYQSALPLGETEHVPSDG